jgi:hypothetical protein
MRPDLAFLGSYRPLALNKAGQVGMLEDEVKKHLKK